MDLLQECVYSESIRNLAEFKQRLVNTWADLKQSDVVDTAITACVRAEERQFKHLL